MRVLALYLDTSALWRLRAAGRFQFISSVVVEKEIAGAPLRVRELMHDTFAGDALLPLSAEADVLASAYLTPKVVPRDYEDDALHVAVCSVARIGHLTSWNFKHLANARREAGFNAVNLLLGYPPVRILSPTLLIHGHKEKDL